jgi:hypothetical protein
MSEEALIHVRPCVNRLKQFNSHAETTEYNQNRTETEDVGNSKRHAKDNAQYTGPIYLVRFVPVYRELMFRWKQLKVRRRRHQETVAQPGRTSIHGITLRQDLISN